MTENIDVENNSYNLKTKNKTSSTDSKMDIPWLPSNYNLNLIIFFVLMLVLIVAMVCFILMGCLINRSFGCTVPREGLSSSLNIMSRSRNRAIRAVRDSFKQDGASVQDQPNL